MKAIILVVCSFFFVASTAAAALAAQLDGKTFAGEVKRSPKEKGDPDTFIFKDGTFRSTSCDQYGFKEGKYSAEPSKSKTKFSATTENDKGAKIVWNGSVSGQKVSGVATLTEADGSTSTMTFSGKAKNG
jgi:hypothetical protein